jgi:hypothetical protein
LFNIFVDDDIDFFSKDNAHVPIIGKMSTPGLLFSDDLTTGPFRVICLQKGNDKW